MNFVYYVLFSIAVFLLSLIGYKKYRSTTLYALAIGGVVNANFFHAGNYPIYCFNLPFGIDSIIYTLFVFCVFVMFIKEGKKSAYLIAISGIIAIMFSAFMQLFADLMSNGSSIEIWIPFFTFTLSSLASIVAIIVMIEVLDKIKSKINQYWLLIIAMIIAIFINSLMFYPLSMIINNMDFVNIWTYLLTSCIGKFIALLCSILTLYLINLYEKRKLTTSNKENKNKTNDNI